MRPRELVIGHRLELAPVHRAIPIPRDAEGPGHREPRRLVIARHHHRPDASGAARVDGVARASGRGGIDLPDEARAASARPCEGSEARLVRRSPRHPRRAIASTRSARLAICSAASCASRASGCPSKGDAQLRGGAPSRTGPGRISGAPLRMTRDPPAELVLRRHHLRRRIEGDLGASRAARRAAPRAETPPLMARAIRAASVGSPSARHRELGVPGPRNWASLHSTPASSSSRSAGSDRRRSSRARPR